VAGVDGTLQDRLTRGPAHRLVRAKTGTTDIASALSGFAGRRFAFVVLQNGRPVDWDAARAAQDRFAQALAARVLAGD
jgi:D-alanyl-D-alanine carboxypeptidase